MQTRHFLVQLLRQHVDPDRVVLEVGEQLELRENLVGEGVAHHERRVPGRVAEVHQTTLAQHQDAATGRQAPLVHLGLDLDLDRIGEALEPCHVDLVVEVADVGDDRQVLEAQQVIEGDHVLVAGARDQDVDILDHALQTGDLEAVHRGLQRVDRVDFTDDDARALATEGFRRTLADIPVAGDEGDLAADQHVGGAVQPVGQRVADAVDVVELRLGDGVVDIDRREQQLAALRELVQTVHAGGGLFGDAHDAGGDLRPAVAAGREGAAQGVEDDGPLVARARLRRRNRAGQLVLAALVDEEGGIPAIVEDQVRTVEALRVPGAG